MISSSAGCVADVVGVSVAGAGVVVGRSVATAGVAGAGAKVSVAVLLTVAGASPAAGV
jgi:hypothetical protein